MWFLHGGDPVAWLDAEGVERVVMFQVLEEAEVMAAKRRKAFIDDVQAAVQNGTAKAFGASN